MGNTLLLWALQWPVLCLADSEYFIKFSLTEGLQCVLV